MPNTTARLDILLMRIAARTIQPHLTASEWYSMAPLMQETADQLQRLIITPRVKRTILDLSKAMQTADRTRQQREQR